MKLSESEHNRLRTQDYLISLFAERTYYRLFVIIGSFIAILKGLRLPTSWPATQAQIDYRYGFLRRGLFGEICRQLHIHIWSYGTFCAISFALLAAFLLLLAWCVHRSALDQVALGAISALIAGSFSISLLVSLVGYQDIVMGILVLLVLLIPRPSWQLAGAAVAGVIGVLLHELYAVAFLPASLAGTVIWASEQSFETGGKVAVRW